MRILLRKQPRPDGRCPDMAISIFCPLLLTLFDISGEGGVGSSLRETIYLYGFFAAF